MANHRFTMAAPSDNKFKELANHNLVKATFKYDAGETVVMGGEVSAEGVTVRFSRLETDPSQIQVTIVRKPWLIPAGVVESKIRQLL